jgi:hypothetical protein
MSVELRVNEFAGSGLGSLFHDPAFFRLHAGERGLYFEGHARGRTRLVVHFSPGRDGVWHSPLRGTFAGYAVDAELEVSTWRDTHARIEQRLRDEGALAAEVVLAPQFHDPALFARQVYVLKSANWTVQRCDLNFGLIVDERTLADRMAPDHRRRRRLATEGGLVGGTAPPETLPAIYAVLQENYAAKGYGLSMTLEQLQVMQSTFPDRMQCFGCWAGERLLAGAICFRVSPKVLYIFYWSARPASGGSSMIVLADAIHEYCRQREVPLLDAGISTLGAQPNEGLIAFKRQLGFTESLRLRMRKDLHS